jgi:hypothetical protein
MEQITPSLTASFRGARRDPTHAPSSSLLPTQFPFLPHTHAPPRPLLSPAQHMLAPNAASQRLHLRSREDLHAPLPATRRGRQGFGLTYPAGPRWKLHRPRPSSGRPRVESRSWMSPADGSVAAMEGFYRESSPSPVPGLPVSPSSLTPRRPRLPLTCAVLTCTCGSIRITGTRAAHEELLMSLSGLCTRG